MRARSSAERVVGVRHMRVATAARGADRTFGVTINGVTSSGTGTVTSTRTVGVVAPR